jgi:hypothetical protein
VIDLSVVVNKIVMLGIHGEIATVSGKNKLLW